MPLIKRDIYEVTTWETPVFWLEISQKLSDLCKKNDISWIFEVASDKKDTVRIALIANLEWIVSEETIIKFELQENIPEAKISKVASKVINPILSDLSYNNKKK